MRWLVKIGFSYNTLAIFLGSGPFVHRVTIGRTSAPTSFRENFIFSPLSTYFPTPKANKGLIGPPNLD